MSDVTPEELRAAGFSGHAGARDDLALRLLCAFNGIDPAKAPPGWKVHSNESTKAAWERVAALIAQDIADFAALKVDIGMYVRMTSDQADEIERLRKAIGAIDFVLARADEKLRIVFKDGCEYVGGVPIQFLLREIADARQVADREINGS